MKADTHPQYHTNTKVTCACGNTFTVGSTSADIHVEICSACHPFYTGGEKIIDTAGRVERFKRRSASAKVLANMKEASAKKKASSTKASHSDARPMPEASRKKA